MALEFVGQTPRGHSRRGSGTGGPNGYIGSERARARPVDPVRGGPEVGSLRFQKSGSGPGSSAESVVLWMRPINPSVQKETMRSTSFPSMSFKRLK